MDSDWFEEKLDFNCQTIPKQNLFQADWSYRGEASWEPSAKHHDEVSYRWVVSQNPGPLVYLWATVKYNKGLSALCVCVGDSEYACQWRSLLLLYFKCIYNLQANHMFGDKHRN